MFVLPSSSNGYVVFHAFPCIPRIPQKNYIGCPAEVFFPISCLSTSVVGTIGFFARRSFAARRGATNSVSHEFRKTTRIGVEPLHIGRRFPTLRQYGQVPPVILRLFAPRRVATLYVGTYICRRQAALTEYRDRSLTEVQKAAARYFGRCARFSRSFPLRQNGLLWLRYFEAAVNSLLWSKAWNFKIKPIFYERSDLSKRYIYCLTIKIDYFLPIEKY